MYTTLALDLDGTLTTSTKEITLRSKEAVQRAYDKGVHIVLASGRPVLGIVPVAEKLGLLGEDATILAYNGGQLVSTRDLEVIWEKVDLRTIHTCFAYARRHKLAASVMIRRV